jgi:hypothetical protein
MHQAVDANRQHHRQETAQNALHQLDLALRRRVHDCVATHGQDVKCRCLAAKRSVWLRYSSPAMVQNSDETSKLNEALQTFDDLVKDNDVNVNRQEDVY